MSTGVIERLMKEHGFGFIKTAKRDLFFHRSEVQGISFELLEEGQMVDFKVSLCPKGLKATNVRVLNSIKTEVGQKSRVPANLVLCPSAG